MGMLCFVRSRWLGHVLLELWHCWHRMAVCFLAQHEAGDLVFHGLIRLRYQGMWRQLVQRFVIQVLKYFAQQMAELWLQDWTGDCFFCPPGSTVCAAWHN